jgi:hypothetical protein
MQKRVEIHQRRCSRCDELYKTTAYYGRVCAECKKPTGGVRGKWHKGQASSLLYLQSVLGCSE